MPVTIRDGVAVWVERWRGLRAWRRPLEEVEVRVRTRNSRCGQYSTGKSVAARRTITITAGANMPDALATILHEYAHVAVPSGARHGEAWQQRFAEAVTEVTGVVMIDYAPSSAILDRIATDTIGHWWRDSGEAAIWKLASTPSSTTK